MAAASGADASSLDDGLPLALGARGTAVVDVQARLSALGYTSDDPSGTFGVATERAVGAFQRARGLRVDGICARSTWNMLVEAGFSLGDRLLYHRQPMLRGDDVAVLQRRLSALGFDTGRVDGIFGPRTATALADFQRNAGLVVDGTCGRDTVGALSRLGGRLDSAPTVADVRERATMRARPPVLAGLRVAIGAPAGPGTVIELVQRLLTRAGAAAIVLFEADETAQALAANEAGADVYLVFILDPVRRGCRASYFAHPTSGASSPAGLRLAHCLYEELARILGRDDGGVDGMALPILRETRMPAAVCEVGTAAQVLEHSSAFAAAVRDALEQWVASTGEEISTPSCTDCG